MLLNFALCVIYYQKLLKSKLLALFTTKFHTLAGKSLQKT